MVCGGLWRSEMPLASLAKLPKLQSIRSILFRIPEPTHELNSGSTNHWFGQEKFVICVFPAGVLPSQAPKLAKCGPAWGTKSSGRASARCGLTLVFFLITDQAHCGAVFHWMRLSRPVVANSFWKYAVPKAHGKRSLFIRCAVRFSGSSWMT